MICCICNFEIPVWYKYGTRWYCLECYRKQVEINEKELEK